jgi:hypothetical protein
MVKKQNKLLKEIEKKLNKWKIHKQKLY